jgi:hypothetical protein
MAYKSERWSEYDTASEDSDEGGLFYRDFGVSHRNYYSAGNHISQFLYSQKT